MKKEEQRKNGNRTEIQKIKLLLTDVYLGKKLE